MTMPVNIRNFREQLTPGALPLTSKLSEHSRTSKLV
jgi:hypothetical protein